MKRQRRACAKRPAGAAFAAPVPPGRAPARVAPPFRAPAAAVLGAAQVAHIRLGAARAPPCGHRGSGGRARKQAQARAAGAAFARLRAAPLAQGGAAARRGLRETCGSGYCMHMARGASIRGLCRAGCLTVTLNGAEVLQGSLQSPHRPHNSFLVNQLPSWSFQAPFHPRDRRNRRDSSSQQLRQCCPAC